MPAVYQGAYYERGFQITSNGAPEDITGWTFQAQIRERVESETVLLELTTAESELTVTDGPNGRLKLSILAADTEDLPVGRLRFDVLRTDISPGPVWVFGGRIPVKQPVTRNE
jgi:hypothetical protein